MAKILIVDDVASNREYLVTLLGYSNHELTEASDGTQALDQARLQQPELIIADIVMPTMDGFEFVHKLRALPQVGTTPVIFYTAAYYEYEARALARDCGVQHIITKPSEPQLILDTVNEALGRPSALPAQPPVAEFDREHLRLMTNKLSQKVTELEAVSLRLQALVEVGQKLASEHDALRLLDTACAAAREIVGGRFAALGMVEAEGMELKQYTVQGLDPTVVAHMSLPEPHQGIIYQALSQRQAVRAQNQDGDPRALGLPADHPPVYSFLVVPISSAARVYGWLGLGNKLGAEEFSDDDERLATSLAAQTAVAYENAQRLAEIERHSAQLEGRVRERTIALQESNNQLQWAEEIGRTGSWEWLIPENRVTWSDGLYKVFGLLPAEFSATYEAYLEQVHPDDREYVRQAVNTAFLAGGAFEFESRILGGNSGPRHLYTRGEMLFNELGEPARMIGTAIDITERKRAEQALLESENKFSILFGESAHPVVLSRLSDHVLVDVNNAWTELFGFTKAEAVGKTSLELGINRDPQRRTQTINEVRRVNSIRNLEQTLFTKSGRALTTLLSINLITIGGENYAINSLQDITERKQMEEALYQRTEDLRRSNSELEHFAYVASHDLQEPLRKVIGFTSLLSKRYQGRLDAEADEFIGFTVQAAARMQDLIQDLLTYSRVGRSAEMTTTDCEQVLNEALANLQVEVETSGAQIQHTALPTVMGNERELIQLFQNLVGNALKFHGDSPPEVHIGARRQHNDWLFSVRDNGIGLDPQFSERIFQMFQRLHRKDEYPGTGIGLAVCKKVVEHHGGHIWVDSAPGAGATFLFTLPADSASAKNKM